MGRNFGFGGDRDRDRDDDNEISRDAKLIDISAEIKIDRPKAWLLFDGSREEWVPKSQAQNNRDGTFTMEEWLAKEKGFI